MRDSTQLCISMTTFLQYATWLDAHSRKNGHWVQRWEAGSTSSRLRASGVWDVEEQRQHGHFTATEEAQAAACAAVIVSNFMPSNDAPFGAVRGVMNYDM